MVEDKTRLFAAPKRAIQKIRLFLLRLLSGVPREEFDEQHRLFTALLASAVARVDEARMRAVLAEETSSAAVTSLAFRASGGDA